MSYCSYMLLWKQASELSIILKNEPIFAIINSINERMQRKHINWPFIYKLYLTTVITLVYIYTMNFIVFVFIRKWNSGYGHCNSGCRRFIDLRCIMVFIIRNCVSMYTTVDIGELGVGEFGSGEFESISTVWRQNIIYNDHR